jgi:hypothetical protein
VAPPLDASLPRAEYHQRLTARRTVAVERERIHAISGNSRFAVAFLGVVLLIVVFALQWLSPAWLLVPVLGFVAVSAWHARVSRELRSARRAVGFYERGLARFEERWFGTGETGNRYIDEKHPCALDLDLFGPNSLFQLLCSARTRSGADRLASWLLAPAAPDEVRARQAAVAELRGKLDLREDLAIFGADVPEGADLAGLAGWAEAPVVLRSRLLRVVALVLAILGTITLTAWVWSEFVAPDRRLAIAFAVVAIAEAVLALWLGGRVKQVIEPLQRRANALAVFHGVLARLEREEFTSPRLASLRDQLRTTDRLPSERIAQFMGLLELLDSERNLYFKPFALVLLWKTQIALALEEWRATTGPAIRGWLDAVAEFEALASLAAYAYENPADPFPDVVAEGPMFDGVGLGHPLLPREKCVRNDVHLSGGRRLLVVSGSNMSGKSTLLRTVGVNVVLALAGAPVRATQVRLSPLVVGATLRVQDSLQAGRSRFFTEVLRVRQLVELSRGSPPLLFLLDELFAGTNSHDRRDGAEAVVRTLVDAGAIGFITTHDLALTHIAEALGDRATNVHFEDQFENDVVTFDYRMRPGVVQRSNALALMRSVGLKV